MSRAVFLLGSRPAALAAARRLGLRALLFSEKPRGDHARSPAAFETVDFDAAEEVVRRALPLAEREEACAVVALTERAVEAAAQLRAALGLAGLSPAAARRFRDKVAMKEAIRAAGLACTDFCAVTEKSGAEELVARLGLPLVVKDLRSSGGRDLVVARDLASVRAALRPGRMAERFVSGIEMSCESFFFQGELLFFNPTEYLRVGAANVVPASLDATLLSRVREFNRACLRALGAFTGMTHLELYRTPTGLLFGEAAARPPGGRIMRLLQAAYGFDPWEALLRLEMGERVQLPGRALQAAGAWVLHPGAGRVVSVNGVEAARAVPGVTAVQVRLQPGAVVGPRLGTGVDVGYIETVAPTRDAAAEALEESYSRLEITME